MRQRDYFQPPMQLLVNFTHSEEFRTRARELGGYDLSVTGTVRFVN
jgi:putative molybdopterin biosynthesis protein